jgi:hypothetical protein
MASRLPDEDVFAYCVRIAPEISKLDGVMNVFACHKCVLVGLNPAAPESAATRDKLRGEYDDVAFFAQDYQIHGSVRRLSEDEIEALQACAAEPDWWVPYLDDLEIKPPPVRKPHRRRTWWRHAAI